MFDACEGCGGIPDHRIDSPKCVQIRAERVRAAQLAADSMPTEQDLDELASRRLQERLMVD